jgi:hypothetical protein
MLSGFLCALAEEPAPALLDSILFSSLFHTKADALF